MSTRLIGFSRSMEHDGAQTAAAFVAVLLIVAASTSAHGQTNVECSALSGNWCLRLSEKEDKLQFGDNPAMARSIETDIGSSRNNYFRSMPTLALTNMGSTGAPDIVKFQMTIGDTRFHFEDDDLGALAVLGMYTPGYQLTSSVSDDGNLLTVNFKKGDRGIAPGETVHFRIDLGLDDGIRGEPFYKYPDFRTVLFDKNGEQYYGPDPGFPPQAEDNSQVTVYFSNGATSGPKALPDFVVTGPQNDYVNRNWHPIFAVDGVDQFGFSGAAAAVPEPGNIGIALLGIFSGLFYRGRSRRTATWI